MKLNRGIKNTIKNKDSKEEKPIFTVNNKEEENITLGDNKILSQDTDIKEKVILNTFFDEEDLKYDIAVDVFIKNSIALSLLMDSSSNKEVVVPWVNVSPNTVNSKLQEFILESSDITDVFGDSIESSGIIDFSDSENSVGIIE